MANAASQYWTSLIEEVRVGTGGNAANTHMTTTTRIQASEQEVQERHSYGELNHREIWITYLMMMMMLASIPSQNHLTTTTLSEATQLAVRIEHRNQDH